MVVRAGLFFQALLMLVLGLYLTSLGVPSDETSVTLYAGNAIIDSLGDMSDAPEVNEATKDIKSSLNSIGWFVSVVSILELIGLFLSMFKR